MFQKETCTDNQNTNFIFHDFFPENRAMCEIMWKNIVEWGQATNDNIIVRMRFAR